MAAREGQGLQIAVIIFAILTIVLAITTFMFYSDAQTARQEKKTADDSAANLQKQNNTLTYRALAAQHVLGMGSVTEQQVNDAKGRAGGADTEADAIMANFKTDMAAAGAQAGEPGALNYRTLPVFLLNSINTKNTSVADANEQTRSIAATKQTEVAAQTARADAAETARNTAVTDLSNQSKAFTDDRTAMQAEKDKLAAAMTASAAKAKTDIDNLSKQRDGFIAEATKFQSTIDNQKGRIKELEAGQTDLFENPDGAITWVNQRQALVWLNLGSADGLLRQTNFSVYDHDENGVANAEAKARLEVVRIVDEHLSEARILEDKPSNPILPGDLVHTPGWSPGQRVHFALTGFMDINNDRVDDFDLVKNIILLNGGVIDAELRADGTRGPGKMSVSTRYVVQGESASDKSTEKFRTENTAFLNEADKYGTDRIDVQKLLAFMGWKPEERTVEMAGSGGGGEFRKRAPGKKQPKAGATTPAPGDAPPADAPMPEGVDPFGAPAPAPAPGADPFADPAAAPAAEPAAAPAAEADPFADP
jgi:hypothetical protein